MDVKDICKGCLMYNKFSDEDIAMTGAYITCVNHHICNDIVCPCSSCIVKNGM